jgi:hypothetical protein
MTLLSHIRKKILLGIKALFQNFGWSPICRMLAYFSRIVAFEFNPFHFQFVGHAPLSQVHNWIRVVLGIRKSGDKTSFRKSSDVFASAQHSRSTGLNFD